VWAHGRIGLAMSRSIGDGECKSVGVIPDPEVSRFTISPATTAGGDGDLFVIVASDGVWEFIESQEACQLVAKHKNATDACSSLVHEAAARWKKFEGSYRDDITAIVAYLPFLEAGWVDEEEETQTRIAGHEDHDETAQVYINMGKQGLSWGGEGGPAGASEGSGRYESGRADDDEGEEKIDDEFVARRLSVHNPFDEDWNEGASADDDDDDDDDTSAPQIPTSHAPTSHAPTSHAPTSHAKLTTSQRA